MPRTEPITIYKFAELSDVAKERARQWYREADATDNFYAECIIEDAAKAGKLMGLDLNQRAVKLMGGGTRMEPIVYWSGFGSQGCGACFEASYSYVKGAVAAIKKEFPMDTMLQGIAQDLQDLQRKYSYKLTATAKHRGHYYHERSMDVSVDHPDWASYSEHTDVGGAMADIFADFAWWIYRRLETAWEWVNSDEVVDENIEANDYEFEEDGSCA